MSDGGAVQRGEWFSYEYFKLLKSKQQTATQRKEKKSWQYDTAGFLAHALQLFPVVNNNLHVKKQISQIYHLILSFHLTQQQLKCPQRIKFTYLFQNDQIE